MNFENKRRSRRNVSIALLSMTTALTATLTSSPARAQTAPTGIVSVCSGVSLPRSVVTEILRPVITGIATPVEGSVNGILGVIDRVPIVGQVLPRLDLNATGLLNDAAQGDPITLRVLDTSGTVLGPADPCNAQADSISLRTPGGMAIGGNRITGLGAEGRIATAGEINSLAFGNGANTSSTAAGAIAFGQDATVADNSTGSIAIGDRALAGVANSLSLGAGSRAERGALGGYAAIGLAGPQASAGEVSIGSPGAERQITNVAAGSALTDAVNVGQLAGVAARVDAITTGVVRYDDPSQARVTFGGGAAGTVLTNVAAGQVADGSTDAVNGDQLAEVADELDGLSAVAVQYDDASRSGVTLGGAGSAPVLLGNIAPGRLASDSNDAVNGAQLFATNQTLAGVGADVVNLTTQVQTGAVGTVQYSDAATPTTPNGGVPSNDLTLVGADATAAVRLHNVDDGLVAAGSTDAVNGGQLFAVSSELDSLSDLAVQYSDAGRTGVVFGAPGAAPVVLSNVAPGTLTATSTEAVNGSQLFQTNQNVAGNTTAITNLTTQVQAGAVGTVQYSNAGTPTTPNGGVPSNDLTLVGADASLPVALHNVRAGLIGASSTDAINGSQLFGFGQSVAAAFGGGSGFDPLAGGLTLRLTVGGQVYGSVQDAFAAIERTIGSGGGVDLRYLQVNSTRAAASATGSDSMALGPNAVASASNSVALGTGSLAGKGASSGYAAVGLAAPQSSAGEVSVGFTGGERQITNVAAGSAPTDAVNVAQLQGVSDEVAALGASAVQYDGPDRAVLTLGGSNGTVVTNVAAGAVTATSTDAVNGSQLAATNAQVADNTTAINNLSVSIANGAAGPVQYANPGSTTPNGGTRTNDVTLVGAAPGAVGLHNVANGRIAAGSTDAVNGGQVYELASAAVNAVSYDTDATGGRTNSVTLAGGNASAPVALRNVADGTVGAGSTDAVNGGQLAATNQAVATAQATATAAGSKADAAMALGMNSVQYDASRGSVTLGGAGATSPVALQNVGPGVRDTDAVNLSQLNGSVSNALSQANAYTDQRLLALDYDLRSIRRDANSGSAGALAAAALPQAYEAGKGMLAFGAGTYGGESAFAVGFSKAFNDGTTVVKFGGTYDTQNKAGANAGIGFQF